MTRSKPYTPPFKVGDRIRYTGGGGFCYGDNPLVQNGDEGTVVENHAGSWGRPDLGPEFAEADDGWSTVEIKGNRMAIRRGWTEHYERVPS